MDVDAWFAQCEMDADEMPYAWHLDIGEGGEDEAEVPWSTLLPPDEDGYYDIPAMVFGGGSLTPDIADRRTHASPSTAPPTPPATAPPTPVRRANRRAPTPAPEPRPHRRARTPTPAQTDRSHLFNPDESVIDEEEDREDPDGVPVFQLELTRRRHAPRKDARKRLGPTMYAAMEARGLFGIIDTEEVTQGSRVLRLHIRPRAASHYTFDHLLPGDLIQAERLTDGVTRHAVLTVQFITRNKYYRAGTRVASCRVGVPAHQWAWFMMK